MCFNKKNQKKTYFLLLLKIETESQIQSLFDQTNIVLELIFLSKCQLSLVLKTQPLHRGHANVLQLREY